MKKKGSAKTNRRFTVLLVPETNEKPLSFRIHRNMITVILAAAAIFAIGVTVLLFKAGDIALKLQLVYFLNEENDRLKLENEKLRTVAGKLDSLVTLSLYLERLATAVGVDVNPLPPPSMDQGDGIFTEDSHDKFLEDLRDGLDADGASGGAAASRPDFVASVPNIRPVEGWITKGFSHDQTDPRHVHNGVDFAAPTGSLVRATAPGVVDSVMNDTYFGLMIAVEHKYGFTTRYAHCSQTLVKVGDRVERGQTIALVGNTGRSTAPHLHYEVLRDGMHVDPLSYILDRGIR